MGKHVLSKETGKQTLLFLGFMWGLQHICPSMRELCLSIVSPIKSFCEFTSTIATVLVFSWGSRRYQFVSHRIPDMGARTTIGLWIGLSCLLELFLSLQTVPKVTFITTIQDLIIFISFLSEISGMCLSSFYYPWYTSWFLCSGSKLRTSGR